MCKRGCKGKLIEINGESHNLVDWCKKFDVEYDRLNYYVRVNNTTNEEVLRLLCDGELSLKKSDYSGVVSKAVYRERIALGWSEYDAKNTPLRNHSRKIYTINGVDKTLKEWAIEYGVRYDVLARRVVQKGIPIEVAVLGRKRRIVVDKEDAIRERFVENLRELRRNKLSEELL